jgi:hypothetical protein
MKTIERNINAIATTTTLFVIATDVEDTDEMLDAINKALLANINKLFMKKNGRELDIENDEIPSEYLAEAFSRLMFINKMAEMAVGMLN